MLPAFIFWTWWRQKSPSPRQRKPASASKWICKEADIIKWRDRNELEFIQCACKITEKDAEFGEHGSKRDEMKQLLKQLRSIYNKVDMNIYNSAKNVNLNTVISYIKDGKVHHFMDDYDKKK